MQPQQTISTPVRLSGPGLFNGQVANVTFRPAPANHGIVFVRTDLGNTPVPALVSRVVKRPRRSAIKQGDASIDTVEHLLSAAAAHRIDNLIVEIDGPEVPILDGSAEPFYDKLIEAGKADNDAPRKTLVVTDPVIVRQGDAVVAATPSDEPEMQLLYELDYGDGPIGRQLVSFDFNTDDYATRIAPSRTFATQQEAEQAQQAGMFTHLTPDDALVIGPDGKPLGNNTFRFDDEPVRHKMLDLIGDLYLLGAPIQGRIFAYKSGHALNQMLVRKLIQQYRRQTLNDLGRRSEVIDIRALFRMMPHRYPMLLVDRVIEMDGDRRAVGVKNVTINEPFFQGHYPNTPIMPGVLVVEAMAQLSGVLIGQSLDQVGKLPVLLSLDRVKLRKPVTPGDQLFLEAEAVKVRSRIAHMRCRAYVGEELAAEAEVKFMMVDDDQE
jgi:UDP-3-O-[3-hydroxymyristoyl] N-acetylglucosamine deacetylase/3-hydroxyacyl-[acyl-carrier-protein] dehydratase